MRGAGHNAGFFVEALSGIDIALWDIRGKVCGLPIYSLLGGPHRMSLPSYGASLILSQEFDSLHARLQTLMKTGHTIVKAKIGANALNPEAELDALRRLAQEYEGRVRFVVDANGMYDFTMAVRVGRALEKLPVVWFEEPLAPDDRRHQAALAGALEIPVAGGETEYTLAHFRDILLAGAYDILQPNVARAGGISECWKIAALAEAFQIPIAYQVGSSAGVCAAATVHLAAATRNLLLYEHMGSGWSPEDPNPFRADLVHGPVDVFDGSGICVPDGPGLGVELDESVIERYRLA